MEYREKYGEHTVILMQVGDFMEMYALPECEAGWNSADCLEDICGKLGIVRTFKNKKNSVCDLSNPMMAGFQVGNSARFVRILVRDHGYTVVEVEQTEHVLPNKLRERRVKRVISPGTYTEDTLEHHEEHNIVTLFLEYTKKEVLVGFSAADLSTGACSYDEMCLPQEELDACLTRYFIHTEPREVLLIKEGSGSGLRESYRGVVMSDHSDRFKRDHKLPAFQNTLLSKVYKDTGMLSPIEYLDMECMVQARYSFCYLTQFLTEQCGGETPRLERPLRLLSRNERLVLSNDSAEQLNVVDGKFGMLGLLNKCKTPMGKRLMRRALLAPFVRACDIHERHRSLQALLRNDKLEAIRKELHYVGDLERLMHKPVLHPHELYTLGISLVHTERVFEMNGMEEAAVASKVSSTLFEQIDSESCQRFNPNGIWGSLFQKGVHPELDASQEAMSRMEQVFIKHSESEGLLSYTNHDRDGPLLTLKKSALSKAQSYLDKAGLNTQPTGNKLILSVTNEELLQLNQQYVSERSCNSKAVREAFSSFSNGFRSDYRQDIQKVIESVELLDYDGTNAFNATRLGLTCPEVFENEERSSFEARGLRHPLIEHFQRSVRYVSNDIALHCGKNAQKDTSYSPQGVIMYGVNASGKSSLMKSVGLAVIMAQAGMYVAASDLRIDVFKSIYTRILNTDNLYKGQSTFVREMGEIRTILNHSDAKTMVIGDELCSGTETQSAVALVGAGIDSILRSGACFLMATHLFELHSIPEVVKNKGVRVCNLSVTFDKATNKIFYDRILRDGPGLKVYGMEVCKSLDMPAHFMCTAERIRARMQKEHVDPKASRYNKRIYMNKSCEVCGKHGARETHHITEQRQASNNRIAEYHKNADFNLVTLCEGCHLRTHRNELTIEGYQCTNKGVELVYHQRALDTDPGDIR